MHTALRELDEEAGRIGLRTALELDLLVVPSPECGLAVRGADDAFRALARQGVLMPTGTVLTARWLIDDQRLVAYRRALLALDPRLVGLLQRGGSRWAALASTVAKNLDAEIASVGEIRSSAAV